MAVVGLAVGPMLVSWLSCEASDTSGCCSVWGQYGWFVGFDIGCPGTLMRDRDAMVAGTAAFFAMRPFPLDFFRCKGRMVIVVAVWVWGIGGKLGRSAVKPERMRLDA